MLLLLWIPIFGGGAPPQPTLYRVTDVAPPAPQGTGPLYRVVDDS